MSFIVRYQKFIDAIHTVEISWPVNSKGERLGQELATIDGWTYCSIPAGVVLPTQPSSIVVQIVDMNDQIKDQISNASPLVRVIRDQVVSMIRKQYSIEDEIKLIRTAPSEEFDFYNAQVEACRDWGREQKNAIGL